MKPPPSLLYWVLAGLLPCACVDLPSQLPIDGERFECTVTRVSDGELVATHEVCAPWTDWETAAESVWDMYDGRYDVSCVGLQKPCDK